MLPLDRSVMTFLIGLFQAGKIVRGALDCTGGVAVPSWFSLITRPAVCRKGKRRM